MMTQTARYLMRAVNMHVMLERGSIPPGSYTVELTEIISEEEGIYGNLLRWHFQIAAPKQFKGRGGRLHHGLRYENAQWHIVPAVDVRSGSRSE
jgi:hypothetical protein